MKITARFRGAFKEGCVYLLPLDKKDITLIKKLFDTKKSRETYNKKEFFLTSTLDLPNQSKTHKQLGTVFKLIDVIFQSMEGRKPTGDEKDALYYDLLEEYGDKVPTRFSGKLRTIRLSESDSVAAAHFIDGLLYHLCTVADIEQDLQSTVVEILWDWASWRGQQEVDPLDYSDADCEKEVTEKIWREKHVYSEATGIGGRMEKAHIVSRGSDAADIEAPWNWLSLTSEEHAEQHQYGWDYFLQKYPHLKGKINRAREKAGKLELRDVTPIARLALEAAI